MKALAALAAISLLAPKAQLYNMAVEEQKAPTVLETDYSMRNYFQNLYEYSPYNEFGSCHFVALCNILTYADTFYNDNIVPEHYEARDKGCQTLAESKENSPGVLKYLCNDQGEKLDFSNAYSYSASSMDNDYQSYVMQVYNTANGTNSPGSFVASYLPGLNKNVCQMILPSCLVPTMYEIPFNHTQTEYANFLRTQLDKKIPVLVNIYKHDNTTGKDTDYHAVVAYDYDASGIYANFGWGESYTRINLLNNSLGYNRIRYCEAFDFNSILHSHSNNYSFGGESHCGCNLDDEVEWIGGGTNEFDPPIFSWKSLYPGINSKELFDVTLGTISGNDYTDLFSGTTSCNSLKFTLSFWNYLRTNTDGFYFILQRHESGSDFVPKTTYFRR